MAPDRFDHKKPYVNPLSAVRVLVAIKPVDFRKKIDGFAILVQEHLRLDPDAGTFYIFRSKRADRVKLLIWDGSGLVMVYKRLEDGRFRFALSRPSDTEFGLRTASRRQRSRYAHFWTSARGEIISSIPDSPTFGI